MATFRSKIKNFPYPAADLQSDSRPRGELYIPDDVMLAASASILVGPNGGVLATANSNGGLKTALDPLDDPYLIKGPRVIVPDRTDDVNGITPDIDVSDVRAVWIAAVVTAVNNNDNGVAIQIQGKLDGNAYINTLTYSVATMDTPQGGNFGNFQIGVFTTPIIRINFAVVGTAPSVTWHALLFYT